MVKYSVLSLVALVASASAFVPAGQNSRVSVQQNALADNIFGLDLFAPVKDQNNYGARAKKNVSGKACVFSLIPDSLFLFCRSLKSSFGSFFINMQLKQGKLTESSYVPSGMTKAQYEKIRSTEKARKDQNYQYNVKKAFQYTDFTEWYAKRGTELNQGWKKAVTLGHTMAKTKYDWSGVDDAKKFSSTQYTTETKKVKKDQPKTTFLKLKF